MLTLSKAHDYREIKNSRENYFPLAPNNEAVSESSVIVNGGMFKILFLTKKRVVTPAKK